MKSIKYITTSVLAALILLGSCSLERNPLDEFAENEFWTNEDNALLAMTGIYKAKIGWGVEYSPTDWWSYGGLVLLELASDNGYDRRGASSNFHKMTDGTLLPNNTFVKNYWENSYTKIARSNRFLEGIEQLPASQDVINRFKAEARFLRATQYFYLSQYFQDVPLVLKTVDKEEANTVKKNSKEGIITFLVKEFTEAAKDLPRFKDLKNTETGRACKQASLAFLGRTLLADRKYGDAAKVYEEIISFGDNIIDPDYASIFLPANENSTENIFSMQYLQDLAGNGMPQHAYPVKDGGWCLINSTASLFEAYRFTDGSAFSYDSPLYDPSNLGKNRDPRLDYTLFYNGATFKGAVYDCHPDSKSPDKIAGGQTTQTGFMMRKYFDESYSGNVNSYGGNIPIIRYAEILLSYLEAKTEAGEGITQSLLDETINKLRTRATVKMPVVTDTNPEKLRAIIRNERQVEFGMEGIRYWDLLRWGIAHEKLNGDVYGAPFPGAIRNSPNKEGIVDPHDRWYVATRKFRKDQDYKWPIPQSEQDINPNLR